MQTGQIIELAEAYAAHRGLKLSTLGVYIVNDGKFFERLRRGSSCTLKTAERAVSWFHENWADDLAWPQHIPRPEVAAKSKTARRVA